MMEMRSPIAAMEASGFELGNRTDLEAAREKGRETLTLRADEFTEDDLGRPGCSRIKRKTAQ